MLCPKCGDHENTCTCAQCEWCDQFYNRADAEQHPDGVYVCRDGKRRTFCCDACALEWEDQDRINQIEARQQWELYGDDYDSWYR